MKIYLDNCVLIDVEDGKYSAADFLSIENATYYYSDPHLHEYNKAVKSMPQIESLRLETINELCGDNYIYDRSLDNELFFDKKSIHQTLAEQNPLLMAIMKRIEYVAENEYNVNREGILNELSLTRVEVSNVPYEKIFDKIDKQMRKSISKHNIKSFLAAAYAEKGKALFSTLFNLLDSVCYWKDDKNINRIYDALHCYSSQLCDILVTNDKRFRYKANAVYHYLNIKTLVMSADDFLSRYSTN